MDGFSNYFNLSSCSIRSQLMNQRTTVSKIKERTLFLKTLQLLFTTKCKFNEISGCLGYSKSTIFIRFFKKHTGASPEQYRQDKIVPK